MQAWFFRHPNVMRLVFNLWPPFLFAGIVITHISKDFRQISAALKWRPWTRNINGTQYGGSLYSMTDPVYATLLLGLLGWEKYYVWDKAGEIEYIAPGRGKVFFHVSISDVFLAEVKARTNNGEKYLPWVEGNIVDTQGTVVAQVKRQLYIRKRPEYRPQTNNAV